MELDYPLETDLCKLADNYVSLALHLHNYDPNPYIYIGDKTLQAEIKNNKRPVSELTKDLARLRDGLEAAQTDNSDDDAYRRALLTDKADALLVRLGILQGNIPGSFEEEVEALYCVNILEYNEDHFRAIASELEQIIPGNGPLPERMSAFRDRFLVSPEHVERIVSVTLDEARKRTHAQLDLPDDEHITLMMNNVGDFGAFAEYLGKGHTRVHFSKTMPFHVDRAVELSTHEAYPGHHIQATLLEAELIDKRGWHEWSLLPLFGAHTVVAEGAANYGVSLSFTREERSAYDRDVVLPLAKLTHLNDEIDTYHRYVDYVERLNYARNEAARRFLYRGWSREQAVDWLVDFGLETRTIAEVRLTLIDAIRSYVITYNSGLDWVTEQIEGHDEPDIASKWRRLRAMFEQPVMPLRAHWGMSPPRPA